MRFPTLACLLSLSASFVLTGCDTALSEPSHSMRTSIDITSDNVTLVEGSVDLDLDDQDLYDSIARTAMTSVSAHFDVPLNLQMRVPGRTVVEVLSPRLETGGTSTEKVQISDPLHYSQAALTSILDYAAQNLGAETYSGQGVLVQGLSECQKRAVSGGGQPMTNLEPGGCSTRCGAWTSCAFGPWGCSSHYGYITNCDNGSTIYTPFDAYDDRAQLCG
ncbi:hypothetical protein [Rubrivirga sp. IMCC43871]|uniref:hypothetical protein n=1 Tax=Rubrivirga sp. IMCC43871 TaxID=3391575 RepID=UPI00398FACED